MKRAREMLAGLPKGRYARSERSEGVVGGIGVIAGQRQSQDKARWHPDRGN
jgi:hypothetical protein